MFEKKKIETNHTTHIRGNEVQYRATFETFEIKDMFGTPELVTSVFSYERTDVSDTTYRPIIMAYNGGPGSASVPVHIGLLGPKRMDMENITERSFLPPYEMNENVESILDICDIIIYDMPMCGFSRIMNEESRNKYFTPEKDADAAIITLRKWMTGHNRWNSPLFLLGESYGTIRNAEIAERISYGADMDHGSTLLHLAGIVMIGTVLNYKQEAYPVPEEILNFIPIAAANWRYRPEKKPELEEFIEEAYNFSYDEYLPALAWGNRICEEKKKKIAQRLNYFTGISEDILIAQNLRIDRFWFAAHGFEDLGICIGMNDTRFSRPADKTVGSSVEDFFDKDVSNNLPMQIQSRCFNTYLHNDLKVNLDEEYEQLCFRPDMTWNYKTEKTPGESLRLAMVRNPELRVMFCTGYYDLLTPMSYARYAAAYHELPKNRLDWFTYNAGHMPYLGNDNSDKMLADLRGFLIKSLQG